MRGLRAFSLVGSLFSYPSASCKELAGENAEALKKAHLKPQTVLPGSQRTHTHTLRVCERGALLLPTLPRLSRGDAAPAVGSGHPAPTALLRARVVSTGTPSVGGGEAENIPSAAQREPRQTPAFLPLPSLSAGAGQAWPPAPTRCGAGGRAGISSLPHKSSLCACRRSGHGSTLRRGDGSGRGGCTRRCVGART